MKLFFALAIIISFASCKSKDHKNEISEKVHDSIASLAAVDTARYTTIQWIDSVKDLGQMKGNVVEKISFNFKNTGDYPLFVISANPSCGCTVADYPKEAIAPGKEGTITAGFDTNNQHAGQVHKSIIVTTNTTGQHTHTLIFTGNIIKEGEPTPANEQPVQKDKRLKKG